MFENISKFLPKHQIIAQLYFDKITNFGINNQKIPQLCFKMITSIKYGYVLLIIIKNTYTILLNFT